ncbi:MAG: hypothetical protein M3O71_31690 [Bacteroidota bacterium]|nr:hypothetical protein [Bacteroidota bacterium]
MQRQIVTKFILQCVELGRANGMTYGSGVEMEVLIEKHSEIKYQSFIIYNLL